MKPSTSGPLKGLPSPVRAQTMPCAGGKVRPVRCGSVLGGKLGSQAAPVQVNHLVSWILENCAPGVFSRLFFEVLKMKALQTIAAPHCSRGGGL